MSPLSAAEVDPVRVGVIGTGRIGRSHATLLRREVPGALLISVGDVRPEAAADLAGQLHCRTAESPDEMLADEQVEAVVIAASSTAHADLIVAAAEAGKAVFCEKPAGMTLAEVDRGLAAVPEAAVPFQVGCNRRFAPEFAHGRRLVEDGAVGVPQLIRSVTRDPGLANPEAVPPGTIFTQTLIHDFDTLLWLNPGAEVVSVHATAGALIAPDYKHSGLLDTAVVVLTFDNDGTFHGRDPLSRRCRSASRNRLHRCGRPGGLGLRRQHRRTRAVPNRVHSPRRLTADPPRPRAPRRPCSYEELQ